MSLNGKRWSEETQPTKGDGYKVAAWMQSASVVLQICKANKFAANPRFARGDSRISFDMLKSLRAV